MHESGCGRRRFRLALVVVGTFVGLLVVSASISGVPGAGAITLPTFNELQDRVSVIDTATNTLAAKAIKVGSFPSAIGVSPDGSRLYVAGEHTVSSRP